jgi:hypothetical protein
VAVSAEAVAATGDQLEATSLQWFFPEMPRTAAQQLLANAPPGAFVVRKSSTEGALVFTCKQPGSRLAHILIANTLQGYKFSKTSWVETSVTRLIALLVLDGFKRKILGIGVAPTLPTPSLADAMIMASPPPRAQFEASPSPAGFECSPTSEPSRRQSVESISGFPDEDTDLVRQIVFGCALEVGIRS